MLFNWPSTRRYSYPLDRICKCLNVLTWQYFLREYSPCWVISLLSFKINSIKLINGRYNHYMCTFVSQWWPLWIKWPFDWHAENKCLNFYFLGWLEPRSELMALDSNPHLLSCYKIVHIIYIWNLETRIRTKMLTSFDKRKKKILHWIFLKVHNIL